MRKRQRKKNYRRIYRLIRKQEQKEKGQMKSRYDECSISMRNFPGIGLWQFAPLLVAENIAIEKFD